MTCASPSRDSPVCEDGCDLEPFQEVPFDHHAPMLLHLLLVIACVDLHLRWSYRLTYPSLYSTPHVSHLYLLFYMEEN